jgi:PAS domain S-box-containing protein
MVLANPKLKLCFRDRIGIVADISSRIAQNNLNIVSMEVVRKDDQAHVYLELENISTCLTQGNLPELFRDIDGLYEFKTIAVLPQEERENRFRTVLDNISDGVISVDKEGRITTINRIACKALQCTQQEVVGQSIRNLNLSDYPILECLRGIRPRAVKQDLLAKKNRFQYISTCKLIRDSANQVIGAVEIAKDLQEIKKLAQCISAPCQISFSDIVGQTEGINEAIAFSHKIATNDTIVTIRGDSGTGKELFARAIHTASRRRGPFVPINCAALPEQLLESELFGYVAGSFTGAKREGKIGLFETAQDGTVFLDEIGEMPLDAQAKLLRLIQEKAVRRIGACQEIPINARLITATNKNLERLVEEKKFREDLYYRISILPIHIPPLRARPGDIPLLVDQFLFQLSNRLYLRLPKLTPRAMEKLLRHDWPGNVRELKNVVDRAAILCDSDTIDADCILFSYELTQNVGLKRDQPAGCAPSGDKSPSLKEKTAIYEKELVLKALSKAASVRQAARALHISHPALLKKMHKYSLELSPRFATVSQGRLAGCKCG